jgi:hypothetical protein
MWQSTIQVAVSGLGMRGVRFPGVTLVNIRASQDSGCSLLPPGDPWTRRKTFRASTLST